MSDLITMSQRLAVVSDPRESRGIEIASKAAQAWAKEQNDYETYIAATHLYIMSRRKTTELIQPSILHGSKDGYGHHDVTLADFGFTKMQWNRRVKELALSQAEIDEYFDECIAKKWEPSLFGLWKYNEPPAETNQVNCVCPKCGREHKSAK
jgi:hypothetical protein